jgi:bifunctional non-homologous end joining protein LigD
MMKSLAEYRDKRDFTATPEPKPRRGAKRGKSVFVIQEHFASHHHYDLRLEGGGVLKSWALPKEPSLNPTIKRLAVRTEDHPLAYANFWGDIPKGQYGAGHVDIWDKGTFELIDGQFASLDDAIDSGHFKFELHGSKLRGVFALVRAYERGGKEDWLFMKVRDEFALGRSKARAGGKA